jgi:hypothetical protein
VLVHLRYFIIKGYPHFHLFQQKEKRTKKEKTIYDDNNEYLLLHLIANLKGIMVIERSNGRKAKVSS